MRTFTFPILIEEDGDGFYVECPALEGCATCGDTLEEAVNNIKEIIKLYLEWLEERHEEIPILIATNLPTVEVDI